MNKKNLISIIILVVLILLFAYTKFNNHTEKKISFFKADTLTLAKAVLSTPKDTITVVLDGGNWRLDSPINAKIEKKRIDDLLGSLSVQTSNIPISESKAKFDKYSVTDSLGTRAQLYDKKGKLLDDIVIGKSGNYSFCNARGYNSNKIYQLEKNIMWHFKPDMKTWRDKVVFKTDKNNIVAIDVKFKKNHYSVALQDTVWKYKNGKKAFDIKKNNKTLSGLFSFVSNVTASDFIDNDFETYKAKLAKPTVVVKVATVNGANITFTIVEKDKSKYILMKDKDETPLYEIYKHNVDKLDKKDKDFK